MLSLSKHEGRVNDQADSRMTSTTTFRPATTDDCLDIARLYQLSSGGVADYIWSQMDAPGLSLLQVGAQRYLRENTEFSYQNCRMATRGGTVVGMCHSYRMTTPQENTNQPPIDPVLLPYFELEVPGSLYISGMAVFPDFQGQGIGTTVLSQARDKAREMGLDRLSLLAFEQNDGAVRLYERHGYRTIDRRAVVPHALLHYTGDVLLMARDVN